MRAASTICRGSSSGDRRAVAACRRGTGQAGSVRMDRRSIESPGCTRLTLARHSCRLRPTRGASRRARRHPSSRSQSMERDLNPRWRFCRALPSLLATHAKSSGRRNRTFIAGSKGQRPTVRRSLIIKTVEPPLGVEPKPSRIPGERAEPRAPWRQKRKLGRASNDPPTPN